MNKELTLADKLSTRNRLETYTKRFPSRNSAANSLKNVSAATVSNILNEKWDNISDEMFANIAWQVGVNMDNWQLHQTRCFVDITRVMKDAQTNRIVTWIVGDAGSGKTTTAKQYLDEHQDVYYILCSEDMKKTDFVREMARCIGISEDGYSIRDILFLVISTLSTRNAPLLIFDEADKLTDSVLAYFITIYNHLEDKVGIVFLSTSYIQRRISNGLRYNKKGYKEIHSRIGRKFFEVKPTTTNDIYAICRGNGMSETETKKVIKEADKADNDLRRVKKVVHALKRAKQGSEG